MRKNVGRIIRAVGAIPEWIISNVPGPLGNAARYLYWRTRMRYVGRGVTFGVGLRIGGPEWISIGDGSWIDDFVVLSAGPPSFGRAINQKLNDRFLCEQGELVIGRNCHIAQHSVLQAHGGLQIGNDCGVASGCRIYSLSHHYRDPNNNDTGKVYKFTPRAPPEEQALIASPVVMEDHTALGLNSVMLPGAVIGRGSWVGVLSTVVGKIPPNVVASGNPAKVVRPIRSDGECAEQRAEAISAER